MNFSEGKWGGAEVRGVVGGGEWGPVVNISWISRSPAKRLGRVALNLIGKLCLIH